MDITDYKETKYPSILVIIMAVMTVFLSAVLIWALFCAFKIYAKFRCQEKILIISSLCVVISAASIIVANIIITTDVIQRSQKVYVYTDLMF
jgi:uncharacterized membrane protein YesL